MSEARVNMPILSVEKTIKHPELKKLNIMKQSIIKRQNFLLKNRKKRFII